jgi:hypothetical protein
VGVGGDEGEKLGKRNGSLAEREVVPLFGRVVVEMDAD